MQGDRKFSHITVTSGEDDDVVIQAGVRAGFCPARRRARTRRSPQPRTRACGGAREDTEPAKACFAVPDGGAQGAPRLRGRVPRVGRRAPAPRAAAGGGRAGGRLPRDHAGRPRGLSMSNMQKAIVVLATRDLVSAVVYYFAVMR